MPITRRRFIGSGLATATLAGLALADRRALAADEKADTPFRHGVASGDPRTDRVILWTRVSPPADRLGEPVEVAWRIARDAELGDVVSRGSVSALPQRDYTVKIDPVGLEPGRTYHYEFAALGGRSPVGRTRTLPVGKVERLRFAFCSCANYPMGYFNAYAAIARRPDLDAVLHLGDYLYEYAEGEYGTGAPRGRAPDPLHEIVSLADYRRRHAQYKADPDLQELHRQHPTIAVWDDHETANDSWMGGAQNHQEPAEGPWSARKAAAVRAYLEWMPIRELPGEPANVTGPRTWRSFRYGDLADLVMLDTRLYGRDRQAPRGDLAAAESRSRTLLGAAQEAWFLDQLAASAADRSVWRIVGQQVMFGLLAAPGSVGNRDTWDGYRASRERILDHIESRRIDNVVFLAGDLHSSWAMDIARQPFSPELYDRATGRGSLAVECVAPAISSEPIGVQRRVQLAYGRALETHPHLRFMDLDHRGYVLLDLDRRRARAEWWFVDGIEQRSPQDRFGGAVVSPAGANRLLQAERPSPS